MQIKFKMKTNVILLLILFPFLALSQNAAPYVSEFYVYNDQSFQVALISYELYDEENDPVEVKVFNLQTDGTWTMLSGEGDIGSDILPGIGKEIYISQNYNLGPEGNDPSLIKILVNDHQNKDIANTLLNVNPDRLYANIDSLQDVRHRITNPDHLDYSRNYLRKKLMGSTDDFKVDVFDFNGYQGENLIGTKTGLGNENEILIIDAHYDTDDKAPGADDNASGVAGVLEALEILTDMQFEKTIQFIAFDLEEEGLKGSLDYVSKISANMSSIIGVLNFEMIGYYTEAPNSQSLPTGFNILFPDTYNQLLADEFRGNFITNVGTENNPGLMNCYDSLAQLYVPELKVISLASPGNGSLVPDLTRSDHAPFWFNDNDAIMLTDGANFRNPYYHTSQDSLNYLNMDFAANVVKATIATAIEKAIPVNGGAFFPQMVVILAAEEPDPCEDLNFYQIGKAIRISQPECLPDQYVWKLYNNAGQFIKESDARIDQILFRDLEPGIYILRVKSEQFDRSWRILFNY